MKLYIVINNYTDGSPRTDTHVRGVYSTRENALEEIGEESMEDPGVTGGSWSEIEEFILDE